MTFDSTLTEYIGLFGAFCYLLSYFLLQIGVIQGQSYPYVLMNLTAAVCVAISLIHAFNSASLIVQSSWILISFVGLIRLGLSNRKVQLSGEEQVFLNAKLPDLPAKDAKRLFRAGLWVDGVPGAELTREGVPVADLVFLKSGLAEVELEGRIISHITPQSYIGEMTCLSGAPATATVRLTEHARYFCINADRLRRMVHSTPQLRAALRLGFADDTQARLIETNRRLWAAC